MELAMLKTAFTTTTTTTTTTTGTCRYRLVEYTISHSRIQAESMRYPN
jgi:hypothetical protein